MPYSVNVELSYKVTVKDSRGVFTFEEWAKMPPEPIQPVRPFGDYSKWFIAAPERG